tara:strand:- start:800 stop:1780 length:981 start_codon:yes stop_codon:yes gene_type:complete
VISILSNKSIFRLSFIILFLVGGWLAFVSFRHNWDMDLKSAFSNFNEVTLLTSLTMIVLQIFLMGLSWTVINQRLEVGDVSFNSYMRAYILGIPARYIPGKVASYVSRAYLLDRTKISKARLAVGYGYEAAFQLIAGSILSSLVFLHGFGSSDKLIYGYTILFTCVIAILAVWDKPFRILVSLYEKTKGAESSLYFEAIRPLDSVKILVLNLISVLVSGLGFFFCINTFFVFSLGNLLVAVGISALSGLIGALVFFIPSGIGVREGVIVSFLSLIMPAGNSIIVAALFRIIAVLADIIVVLLVAGLWGASELRQLRKYKKAKSDFL